MRELNFNRIFKFIILKLFPLISFIKKKKHTQISFPYIVKFNKIKLILILDNIEQFATISIHFSNVEPPRGISVLNYNNPWRREIFVLGRNCGRSLNKQSVLAYEKLITNLSNRKITSLNVKFKYTTLNRRIS